MLRADPRNPRALELRDRLASRLPELPEELVLVLGGDGHMLSVIHEMGLDHIYLGLNCGRVGFLLNEPEPFEEMLEQLQRGAWRVHEMPRLVATAEGRELGHALNDIYLERDSGQTAHLRVCVDGEEVVQRMVCDGVIVSTALGSTAYALAAGGPAVHFGLHTLQLTSIAPHRPRLPSIVLPEGKRIQIEVHHPDKRPVRAVADGRDLELVERVEVALAPERARLAFLRGHDPTRALIRKLIEG